MRDAILQAAWFLQEHPEKFRFQAIVVPSNTVQTGCALGWVGYFTGPSWQDRTVHNVAEKLLGVSDSKFYFRMDLASKWLFGSWTFSGRACSRALRKYADKYFPDPTGMKEYMYV